MTDASAAAAPQALPDAVVRARLAAELPAWSLADGQLQRRFGTDGWRATLMAVNTIGHLAEAAWHHPDLALSYASVTVRLSTHDAGGISDRDFALARKIDEVLLWQPGREPGTALTGPPDGPGHRYLQQDG